MILDPFCVIEMENHFRTRSNSLLLFIGTVGMLVNRSDDPELPIPDYTPIEVE